MRTYRVFECDMRCSTEDGEPASLGPGGAQRITLEDAMRSVLHQTRARGNAFNNNGERKHRDTITIEAVASDADTHLLHLSCGIGKEGSHDYARSLDVNEDEIPLQGKSAESTRHVTFVFPAVDSGKCLVVVEADGNTDPKSRLDWLIRTASQERRTQVPVNTPGRPVKLMPRFTQMADPSHTAQLLREATSLGAAFKGKHRSARGNPEDMVTKRRVTLGLENDEGSRNWLIERITSWKRDGADEVTMLNDLSVLLLDGEEDEYDEANILIGTPRGQVTITLQELLEQSFSYPVGDLHPRLKRWFELVFEKSTELSRLRGLDCTFPPPSTAGLIDDLEGELDACQTASPPDPSEAESTGDSDTETP